MINEWKLGYFRENSRVRKLNLNNNKIQALPEYACVGLEGLVTLEIRNNSLNTFSSSFNREFTGIQIIYSGFPNVSHVFKLFVNLGFSMSKRD